MLQRIEMAQEMDANQPPRKRVRIPKPNPEKKFECDHDGCGKSYTRAEHLHRHQLNHAPKNIYHCDFPGCNRYFVRQDLCVRHRERHTTYGSQLHRRDTFAHSTPHQNSSTDLNDAVNTEGSSRIGSAVISPESLEVFEDSSTAVEADTEYQQGVKQRRSSKLSNPGISPSLQAAENRTQPLTPAIWMSGSMPTSHKDSKTGNILLDPQLKQDLPSWETSSSVPNYDPTGNINDPTRDYLDKINTTSNPERRHGTSSSTNPGFHASRTESTIHHSPNIEDYAPLGSTNFHTDTSGFAQSTVPESSNSPYETIPQNPNGPHSYPFPYPSLNTISSIDMNGMYNIPLFGGDEYNQTPFAPANEFTAWLFDDNQMTNSASLSSNYMPGYVDVFVAQAQGPSFSLSPSSSTNFNTNVNIPHSVGVTGFLDSAASAQYIMSEEKRQELLQLMQTEFIERPHDAVKKRKDSVFEGNPNSDGHILSLRMMHTYIGSYWYHQHAQLPILHKPTFSADRTPNLLLLAIIAIGAATLDKAHGHSVTDPAAEFANFIAWHVRWEIMRDADFRPPAKLWIFQALLLIEIYEKMYATRALHERAHIHHDSTLTLMKRGSSLVGRSALDSPPSLNSDVPNDKTGSNPTAEYSRSEELWKRWIAIEATTRVAFGAFVIDSTHAIMFGHAAKMVAHEMRLPLPCDEGLWSATSPAEASRVQSTLQTNGIKPIIFLDGLKKTLNGQRVRTNSFGRTILMAGLMSVSWHMNQRDIQISSLGARTVNSFGGPDKWKGVLIRAFDNWKRDFDEALAESAPGMLSPSRSNLDSPLHALIRPVDDENIFESRTVLHHLAHIAANVDVVDCQVFAGANRILGRAITPKDHAINREKIERWATKASARDATFYALKFLAQVLIPPADRSENLNNQIYGYTSPILPQAFEENQYIARDDFLLNRPWVLYIAALVVWCYGFALEGPIYPPPGEEDLDNYAKREKDMRNYLDRVAGVLAPNDLEDISGKNCCLGLLMILQDSLGSTRWELTHEAAGLLGNACRKLMGTEEQSTHATAEGRDGSPGQNTVASAARI